MSPSRPRPRGYHPPRGRGEIATAVLGVLVVLLFTVAMVWVLGPHDGGSETPSDLPLGGQVPTTQSPTTAPAESVPAPG